MSTGWKVLLIVLGIGGVCCLVCCGGAFYFARTMMPKISNDPADVDAARNEIATIKLPAGFKPVRMMKMDNFAMTMTVVEYEDAAIDGKLVMTEMNMKIGGDPAQRKMQMQQQMNQQGFGGERPFKNSKSESKTLKVKGQDCTFEFSTGEDPQTKKKLRQVVGTFEGKTGPALLRLDLDESAYKQDEIIKMLEGIQ